MNKEQNKVVDEKEAANESGFTNGTETETEARLRLAEEANNVWEFEGRKLERFVARGEFSVADKVLNPNNRSEVIATLIHNFRWQDVTPFVARDSKLNTRYETVGRSDEQERKLERRRRANAELYQAIIADGVLVKGDQEIAKQRDWLLKNSDDVQSKAIEAFYQALSIERYLPDDISNQIEVLLQPQETVMFIGYLGGKLNPAAIFLFEMETPSPDERDKYDDYAHKIKSVQQGDVSVSTFSENFSYKYRFAQKHLRDVRGVSVATEGVEFSNTNKGEFCVLFNPYWIAQLGEKLYEAFDVTKGK